MEKNEIHFRKANVEDSELLAKMRWDFLHEISTDKSENQKENLIHSLELYFREQLTNKSIVIWLAEAKGEIVSTSTMVLWNAPIGVSGIDKNGRGYILNMYTIPSYRRKGLGKMLMTKLVQTGKELKLEKLHLHATQMGTPLYKSYGFETPYYQELELKL